MFGLMTNVMLAVTTAFAAVGVSLVGNADVTPEVVEPPNVDLPDADVGATWDVTTEHGAASGGANVADGGADAFGDADTEHVDGSGSVGASGLGVPELPAL